ncbi:MAG: nucleotide exchange factor GrpE, partial [Actinomycetota bacterium]|nr:nucleotide exchange factor GrpE [Actinomycetota bacterium]
MNPSDEENQNQGPVIRDRRRIDPLTGQVRDIPGQVKPGKHSAAQQPGQHPAPPQSATPGARA